MTNEQENMHTENRKYNDTVDNKEVEMDASNIIDHMDNETTAQTNQPAQKDSKKNHKSKVPFIMSGIIGGVISAIIVVLLFTSNVIPIINPQEGDANAVPASKVETKTLSADLTSDNADIPSNIDKASQAVVGIVNLQQQNIWTDSEEAGAGSGIIYKKENGKAYVVTNNHVVDGAKEIEVVLNNEERIKAKVLGTDALTDLAVLEIDGEKIEVVAEIGSSNELQVGETVITIGNPLGMDFSGSVTKGIVSGLERTIEVDTNGDKQPDWITEVIQTDAAINPGNSGGALVNTDGEVIGINSMKIARQSVEGIGFAIPSDAAIPIMEQLETKGEITRPLIGISTVSINQVPSQYQNRISLPEDSEGGMVIADVQAGSPADAAGLQQFDVVTKINDQKITSILDLRVYMYSETTIGDTLEVKINRDGKQQTVDLTLTARNE